MKTILRLSVLIILSVAAFSSCKKDETKLYYTGGTAPMVSTIVASDTPSYANADKTVLTLNWTNPNYNFTTGVSSYNVTYLIQIDTVGSNFTNPLLKEISVSEDLSYSFTSSALNDIMLNQLNLDTAKTHNLEMRVISNLTNNSARLLSNSVQYKATAYAIPPKIPPPASGTLFIVGSATAGGWNNPITVDPKTQQFTQVSKTEYIITIPLIGNDEYKLIGVDGFWDQQWSIAKLDDPTEVYGGDFVYNGANVLAPPADGTYKIDVDFQKGKFTVTKQ